MAETSAKGTAATPTTAKPKTRPKSTSAAKKTPARRTSVKSASNPSPTKSSAPKEDAFATKPLAILAPANMAVSVAVPESFRTLAEKTLKQSQAVYLSTKDTVEEASGAVESSIGVTGRNVKNFNQKLLDMAQNNMQQGFDYMRELASARDLSEAFEAQSNYMQQQIDSVSSQAQEISDLSTKMAEQSSEPIKKHITKSWSKLTINIEK